jgi:RHS repeat-associated protein
MSMYYAYDGQNRRIWSWNGGVDTYGDLTNYAVNVYTPVGQKLGAYKFSVALLGGTYTPTMQVSLASSDQYFGGRRLAVMDQLGSAGGNTATAGSFFPWGEPKATNPQDTWSYATYWADSATGLDYANNRYYSNAYGRFMTADPDQSSAKPSDPQSWNRYAYVTGDPVNKNDPTGLDDEDDDDDDGGGGGGGAPQQPTSGGGGNKLKKKSSFPLCNPQNSASEEADLKFIASNYSSAMTGANTIQTDLHALNPNLNIDTGALAVTFLQWSASETGTPNGWGTAYLLGIQNNYFGMQVGAAGSIPCTGIQYVPGSTNACYSPGTSFASELFSGLSAVPHTLNNPNPGDVSYLGDLLGTLESNPNAGTATILQAIANAGWNPSPSYGSKDAGANVQGRLNCLKQNGYIQ